MYSTLAIVMKLIVVLARQKFVLIERLKTNKTNSVFQQDSQDCTIIKVE